EDCRVFKKDLNYEGMSRMIDISHFHLSWGITDINALITITEHFIHVKWTIGDFDVTEKLRSFREISILLNKTHGNLEDL
ncbi:hypothetical protein DFQ28_000895, partial [Apophysomyces sp. BC1034]